MSDIAAELRLEVESALPGLRSLSDADVTRDRGAGKWLRKEILGHLIDSAFNNDQRFVLAQLAGSFAGASYDQEGWVRLHAYRNRSWSELVDTWAAVNRHVANAIDAASEAGLQARCVIGGGEPVSLEWLMRDYVRHLRHHLAQITGGS